MVEGSDTDDEKPGAGLAISQSQAGMLNNNTIRYNREDGVTVTAGGIATIDDNTIAENGGHGVKACLGSLLVLHRNVINDSSYSGVVGHAHATVQIGGATIRDNRGGVGISTMQGSKLMLEAPTTISQGPRRAGLFVDYKSACRLAPLILAPSGHGAGALQRHPGHQQSNQWRMPMTLQDWGSIGEVVGALAVVVTLIYLAKQIRQNTRAMDESRKLALAQTYQMRSDALQAMLVHAADSEHIGPIIIKLTGLGYPENVQALDALSDAERRRFRMWQIAQQTHWDNMHYQYQQGYLDREYYEDAFKDRVVRLAPTWKALGLTSGRRSFFAEIERLSRE